MKIPHRTTDLFAFLFDPRARLLFLLGALIVAVMGNAAFAMLFDLTRNSRVAQGNPYIAQGLIIGSGLVLIGFVVVSLKLVAKIILNKSVARVGGSEAFSVPRRAIIFTVGKQSDTIELCLRLQQPEFVGFICTKDSQSFVDDIVGRFALSDDKWEWKTVDPWDVKDVRFAAEYLISWAQARSVPLRQIAFDVTGGLTPMSVGAFVVAQESRIDSQYVRSDYDGEGHRLPKTEQAIFISRFGDEPMPIAIVNEHPAIKA